MIFNKLVPLVIQELRKKGFYHRSRTTIQKVIYFSLNTNERKNYYIPYLYGPYSEDVQIAILNYETFHSFHYDVSDTLNDEEEKIYHRIKKTIEFLKKKEITQIQNLALLSKVHFITIQKGIEDNSLIRKYGLLLGWKKVSEISLEELNRLKEISRELEDHVHNQTSS